MTTPLILILVGTLCRIIPHAPNLMAMGAVALFAGAKLPKAWAWIVPVAAMFLSDLYLDWDSGRPAITASRLTIYLTYVAIATLGLLARRARGWTSVITLPSLSLTASALFFVTTNFAEWLAGPLRLYPHTAAGLLACYGAAIPFFQNTVLADLVGTSLLFGFDALARRIAGGRVVRADPRFDLVDM